MKRIAIALLLLAALATGQTLEDYSGQTAAQLSAMTDRVTVPNTSYWNTHAYLQLQLLIERILALSDSTGLYTPADTSVTWAKLVQAVRDSINVRLEGDGTAGYLPKYYEIDSLANSILYEASGKLGVGLTAPTEVVDVDGDVKADTLKAYVEDNRIGYAALDTAAAGYIDVRKFGAVGDGVTDDTDAIQAAIDYAYALGGGTVFFPNGTYLVSKKRTYSCLVTYAYVELLGTGRRNSGATNLGGSSTLVLAPAQNTCIIVNKDHENWMSGSATNYWHYGAIKNLYFDCNGANNATKAEAIKIYKAGETSVIRDVLIGSFRDTALVVNTATPALIENVACMPYSSAGATERIGMKLTGRTCRVVAPSGDGCSPFFYLHGAGSVVITSPKMEFTSDYGNPAIYIEEGSGSWDTYAPNVSVLGGTFIKTPVASRNGDLVYIYSDSIFTGKIQLRGIEFAGFKNIVKQHAFGITDSLYRTATTDYWIDDIVWGDGYKHSRGDFTHSGGITTAQTTINETGLYTDRLYTPFLRVGEKQNHLLQSQNFNTTWSKSTSLTINSDNSLAPDGTMTADEIVNAAGSTGTLSQNVASVTLTQGAKNMFSVWMKAAGTAIGNTVTLYLDGFGGGTSQYGKSQAYTLTGQWELYTVKMQMRDIGRTGVQCKIAVPASTDSIYVWGAQLNSGWELYPYTATTTAAITSGSQAVGGNVTFANAKSTDSTTVGSGGIWMRNWFYVAADSSVAMTFYNTTLARLDTVYAKQQ